MGGDLTPIYTINAAVGAKICPKCSQIKAMSEFYRRAANVDGKNSWCKVCHRATVKAYRDDPKNRDKRRAWNSAAQIKKLHGLSMKEYRAFLATHGDRCFVCRSTEKLCIDHDHATGRKRGVLCKRCNMALGFLKDDLRRAYGLIDYIAKRCGQ